MCDGAMRIEPYFLAKVPNRFKTQKVCNTAVSDDYFSVWFVPDCFVPDCFVTQQRIKDLWDNNSDWYNNKLIEWYDGFKARKAQKAQIKKELILIAWHPLRWWDWCVPEDEKTET